MTLPKDTLRTFNDLDDLFDSNSNEIILMWVNQLAAIIEQRRIQSRRYLAKQKACTKLMYQMLDPDEIERMKEEVEERLQAKRGVER